MRLSCHDPEFNPAEDLIGHLDRLSMFVTIMKIPTNYYTLTTDETRFGSIFAYLESKNSLK